MPRTPLDRARLEAEINRRITALKQEISVLEGVRDSASDDDLTSIDDVVEAALAVWGFDEEVVWNWMLRPVVMFDRHMPLAYTVTGAKDEIIARLRAAQGIV